MCGIVAAIAERNVSAILIEGLKRLEYRGYDSAGVAICGPDGLLRRSRRIGKVAALEQARSAGEFERIVQRWGVRRSDPRFWSLFHDLSAHIRGREPVEAGVLDMNRYQNL